MVYSNPVCPICSSTDSNPIIAVWDFRFNLGKVRKYQQCIHCLTHFLYPVPENLDKEYPQNYSAWFRKNKFKKIHDLLGVQRKQDLRGIAWESIKNASNKKEKSILDVGAGGGILLESFKRIGYHSFGLDWSKTAADNLTKKGYNVIPFEDLGSTDYYAHFDFIILHHVLEHVGNPIDLLSKLEKWLKPSGKIVVIVPSIQCWAFDTYGEFYNHLDGGRHLIMYTTATLVNVLQLSGYKIQNHQTRATSNSLIHSWFRSKGIQPKFLKWYQPILKFCLLPLKWWISLRGKGEIITVVAGKGDSIN